MKFNINITCCIVTNILLSLVSDVSFAQNTIEVTGIVIDAESKERLSFCAIGVSNNSMGTITNEKGYFRLVVPDSLAGADVNFSYLGYKAYQCKVNSLKKSKNRIELIPVSIPIGKVIVRPHTPEDIIRMAIRKIPDNYPNSPFVLDGFYKEVLKENDLYIQYLEAFLKTYNFPYNDTASTQVKLVQGRTRDDLSDIQFLRKEADKRYKKLQKRAERKGEELDEKRAETVKVIFDSPHRILGTEPIRSKFFPIDTTQFKKFDYMFEKDNVLGEHELYTISYNARRQIKHILFSGKIYIDKETFAIVQILSHADFVMPAAAKPILAATGLSITNMRFDIQHEYAKTENTWYLRKVIMEGSGDFRKRRTFDEDDLSHFEIEHAFVSTRLQTKNISPIPPEERIIPNKKIIQQLGDYDEAYWRKNNKIEYILDEQ
ncbi:MAG: carboxypeptidase-like regulatory domain-containing protein [Bacteroidales bacterium]|nr:carboxypeptidase-like regulatory domain-containing protein [Bacteroidales bacterium]